MLTIQERKAISAIAQRASAMYAAHFGRIVKPEFIAAEIEIVHQEITALRLDALLDADNFNFAHDIVGIHDSLEFGNPSRLKNCFLPRFTA
jgi:hypothetical protein